MNYAGTYRTYSRAEVSFDSSGDRIAAWLYTPEDEEPNGDSANTDHPSVVMAPGFGGTRAGLLESYAERFAAAGMAVLLFDYRHFGDSGGEPRQLLDIKKQLEDWRAAVAWARSRPEIDSGRLALWGTSFSGGHVQILGAEDSGITAIVAQVPFCDGRTSTGDARQAARLAWQGIKDLAAAARGKPPVEIPLVGPPGALAAMTSPDAMRYVDLNPPAWQNRVSARVVLSVPNYRPGLRAPGIQCPIMYSTAEKDELTPPEPVYRAASSAPRATLKRYPVEHFDIYVGEPFERAVDDQLSFLKKHLNVLTTTQKEKA